MRVPGGEPVGFPHLAANRWTCAASRTARRLSVTGGVQATTRELGCSAIHPRYELCLRTDLVGRAHDAGLRVAAWTADSRRVYRALRDADVDAVIVDDCDRFAGPDLDPDPNRRRSG